MAIAVNVVPVSAGIHGFTAAYAPQQHPGNHQYVLESLANISQNVYSQLGSIGQMLYSQAQTLYNQYDGHEIMEVARHTLREIAGVAGQDVIYMMNDLEQMQNAQPVMQMYIMANPVIANLYATQRCDGYSGSYVNHYEHFDVYDNPYYISAVNGVMMPPDARHDPDVEWCCDNYVLDENSGQLNTQEQFDVINTYMAIEQQVKWGNDPTDILDNQL